MEKNKVGRPPIHTDPEEVERLCNDYFEWIKGEKDEKGDYERRPEPPTVTGLTLHLGFCNKSSLYDYADKPEFSNPIKKAISRIEKHHEIAIAYGDKCTGNIFALKNFGWKDRSEVEHNVNVEQPLFPEHIKKD